MITTLFTNPLAFALGAIAITIAITVHEFAHAKAADELGDPTPRMQGRVTLNPRAHLDLWGTLFIFLVGFGWGRPVQFDPFNLDHPRRDAAIISFAGPLSNFLMAGVASLIMYGTTWTGIDLPLILNLFLMVFIRMNILLGVFNLIPIHPLDGFKIVGGLLSEHQAREWYQLEKFGFLFLIMLIIPFGENGALLSTIISPVLNFLYGIAIP